MRLFGTDGVRGVANEELTGELAFSIGKAAAYVLSKETEKTPLIIIGKDTRNSGYMLEYALAAGICSMGANVLLLGVIPTPAVAYLTRKYKADAGVVISASHNSAEYNGIKIFNGEGYKLSDEMEEEIEDLVLGEVPMPQAPRGDRLGKMKREENALKDYADYVKSIAECNLEGMKIAIDCANGASYKVAPKVIFDLGAEVYTVHNYPNGRNINADCGSTHTKKFCKFVKNIKADIGLTFDGDADRLLVVDELGNLVDGDKILLICAEYFKSQGTLKKDTLVTTVMTNIGLVNAAKERGINMVQTQVGDRNVLAEMLKNGYSLGGEESGHMIFIEHATTGDGLVSAINLLNILQKSGKKLSELASGFVPAPQIVCKAKVSNQKKHTFSDDAEIMAQIKALEEEFADEGRLLVRASGTEPCVRVLLEGNDQSVIEQKAKALAEFIEKRLA